MPGTNRDGNPCVSHFASASPRASRKPLRVLLACRADSHFPHEPDHIIAEKHGGSTELQNLAWACFDCNRFKGPNIASLDGGEVVQLFNPRKQTWSEHFEIRDGRILPLSKVGRVTEQVLRLNLPQRIEARAILAALGDYPGPED